jgi:hypothetical protein
MNREMLDGVVPGGSSTKPTPPVRIAVGSGAKSARSP